MPSAGTSAGEDETESECSRSTDWVQAFSIRSERPALIAAETSRSAYGSARTLRLRAPLVNRLSQSCASVEPSWGGGSPSWRAGLPSAREVTASTTAGSTTHVSGQSDGADAS